MFSRRCSFSGHGCWERKWESRAIVDGHVVLRAERVDVGRGSATQVKRRVQRRCMGARPAGRVNTATVDAERVGVVVVRPATCFHVVELHVVTVGLEKWYLVHNIVHVCEVLWIRSLYHAQQRS